MVPGQKYRKKRYKIQKYKKKPPRQDFYQSVPIRRSGRKNAASNGEGLADLVPSFLAAFFRQDFYFFNWETTRDQLFLNLCARVMVLCSAPMFWILYFFLHFFFLYLVLVPIKMSVDDASFFCCLNLVVFLPLNKLSRNRFWQLASIWFEIFRPCTKINDDSKKNYIALQSYSFLLIHFASYFFKFCISNAP